MIYIIYKKIEEGDALAHLRTLDDKLSTQVAFLEAEKVRNEDVDRLSKLSPKYDKIIVSAESENVIKGRIENYEVFGKKEGRQEKPKEKTEEVKPSTKTVKRGRPKKDA